MFGLLCVLIMFACLFVLRLAWVLISVCCLVTDFWRCFELASVWVCCVLSLICCVGFVALGYCLLVLRIWYLF